MRAVDIMTREVITVGEKATIPEVAGLLAKNGISAVPVVDKAGRVIGMVSEGDLLHRAETGTERRRSWWLDLLASTDQLARDYVKSHAQTVTEAMTRDVISVTEENSRRRHCGVAGGKWDQAGAGHARRQTGRNCQPRQPRPGFGNDPYRTSGRRRQ